MMEAPAHCCCCCSHAIHVLVHWAAHLSHFKIGFQSSSIWVKGIIFTSCLVANDWQGLPLGFLICHVWLSSISGYGFNLLYHTQGEAGGVTQWSSVSSPSEMMSSNYHTNVCNNAPYWCTIKLVQIGWCIREYSCWNNLESALETNSKIGLLACLEINKSHLYRVQCKLDNAYVI